MPTRILVIGAGIIGLATALELARRGAGVTVLDRQTPGQESSWAGAGILSLLLPWDYGKSLNHIAERSISQYPVWIDRILGYSDTDPEFRKTGMWVLPPYDARQARQWQLASDVIPLSGPPARILATLPGREGGLWLPEVAQVRNPRLLTAMLEALPRLGVTVHFPEAVTGLEIVGEKVTAARVGNTRWHADAFVVTAGAWSTQVLGNLGTGLPVRPVRGQILLFQSVPDRLPCIVYERGHYLVPRRDGKILAGSTQEDVGFDKSVTAEARASLQAFVSDLMPDIASSGPLRQWSGLRPGSPENRPIISPHPELANLYVNSGHFRYGVTLAPASAELIADLIEDRKPKLDPRLFAWPDIIRPAPV